MTLPSEGTAPVTTAPEGQRTLTRTDIQIVDLRRYGGEVTRLIESRLSRLCSAACGIEAVRPGHEAWHFDGAVGGTLACRGTGTDPMQPDQIRVAKRHLAQRYADGVSDVWSSRRTEKATMAPGLLHVVTVTWTMTVETGTLTAGGQKVPFSALTRATATQTVSAHRDEAELAPAAREAFDARLNYLALAG